MRNFELSSDKGDKGKAFLFIFMLIAFIFISGILTNAFSQKTTDSLSVLSERTDPYMPFIKRIFNSEADKMWKLNSIALTTGKTPLSSGLNFDVLLSKGKNVLYLSYNTILGQVIYEIPLTKWFSFQPTGGIYHNLPWAGPLLTFKVFNGKLITNHWFGWAAGIPKEGETSLKKTIMIFSFQEMKYTFNKTSLDYILMHCEKNSPIHLFGIARKFQIEKSSEISSSFTYVHPTKEIMWSLGFILHF